MYYNKINIYHVLLVIQQTEKKANIKACISSNLRQIPLLTKELAAHENLKSIFPPFPNLAWMQSFSNLKTYIISWKSEILY